MKSQEKSSETERETIDFNYKIAIKASQELSDEIFKENLFSKILNFCSTILNATKAVLLIYENSDLKIRAIQSNIIHEPIIVDSMDFENSRDLSHEIVQKVIKSNKHFIFNSENQKEPKLGIEYLREKKIKSLLCYPLIYHQKQIGILYLENDSDQNSFPSEIHDVYEHVMRQISISLKNAILYSEMEKRLIDRTHEL